MDLFLILVALPFILPIALAVALYIKLVSPGPVLYRQVRVGYRERKFELLKFRSMHTNADATVHINHTTQLLRDNLPLTKIDAFGDARWIPLGGLLRSSGLDELPQVINVIRREMSLVGPRPSTTYEHALLTDAQKARFDVLPGLTGLWQVNGKNNTTFQQMIELDAAYARNRSLWLDLRIVARTIPVLIRQVLQHIRHRLAAPDRARHTDGQPDPANPVARSR